MKTNVINILSAISYLAKSWSSCYGSKCCWPIKLQDSLKCNLSRKEGVMKFVFGLQIRTKVFYKYIILGVHSRACPKYLKQEVCISLQFFQKNLSSEVDFLPADKQSFLQFHTMTLVVQSQVCLKYPK